MFDPTETIVVQAMILSNLLIRRDINPRYFNIAQFREKKHYLAFCYKIVFSAITNKGNKTRPILTLFGLIS